MEKPNNTLLKGLLVIVTLALSKQYLLNVNENNQFMLISAMTVLAWVFARDRLVDPAKDVVGVKRNLNEIFMADPVFAENTLTPIQSTLTQLTPKESDVLRFLANGLMHNEIAKKLGVSKPTIKNHLNSILRKLNTSLTAEAMVKAVRHGFINITNSLDFYHYHKGSTCSYKPILCQEGWCSECSICREKATESSTLFSRS
jgi:DNA-binding CsgD family transcriptional regulator